ALLGDLQRLAHLHQHGHQQPQQQEVAHDQRDVGQSAAEDEERQETADERGERDPPSAEKGDEPAHPARGPSRSAMRRAPPPPPSARTHSSTSAPAACVRRWAPTSSSAPARTSPVSAQISRRTRAMEASPSATRMMVSTYCSLIIAPGRPAAG